DWGRAIRVEVTTGSRPVLAADVVQEAIGEVGAEHPAEIVLRQQRGLRRAYRADTVIAAFVGACDGELDVGQLLDAIAGLLELDSAATRETYLPVVHDLLEQGFLTIA